MAKRFGRTQRRKLRQEVENLREAYDRELGLLRYNENKLSEIRRLYADLFNNVEQVFGKNSALLPPKVVDMNLRMRELRLPVRKELDPMSMWDVDPMKPCFMEMHYITLEEVRAVARQDPMSGGHHVQVRLPDGSISYFVTPDVMKMRGIPHEVRRNVVRYAMDVLNHHLMEYDGTKPRKE